MKPRRLISLGLVVLASLSSGCLSFQGSDGKRHTLVLGIGFVTQAGSGAEALAATSSTILGLEASLSSPSHLSAGFVSRSTVAVPVDSEGVILSAQQFGLGRVNVSICRACCLEAQQEKRVDGGEK